MEKKWQGKLLAARWEEDQLNQRGCFAWLKNWDTAPSHTIVGMLELYEQLSPTKVYDTLCRFCGKTAESTPHVLASCSALAQCKYLARHNAALKVLFWEMLRELQLSDTVPPWYCPGVVNRTKPNQKRLTIKPNRTQSFDCSSIGSAIKRLDSTAFDY